MDRPGSATDPAELAGLRLDDQLCFALYAATNAIVRDYRPLLREIGLTYPQYLLMMCLWQDGVATVGQLARRLELDSHAVSPLVDRLEAAGLVRRRPGADRRQVLVEATRRGRDLETAAARAQSRVAGDTGLTPHDLAELRRRLRELAARLADAPSAPGRATSPPWTPDTPEPRRAAQGGTAHPTSPTPQRGAAS